MALIDTERAETALRGDGPGASRSSGGSAREHDRGRRVAREPRPRSSAGCATTSSARSTSHDLRAVGCRSSTRRRPPTGLSTGVCLIARDARRRADDEHLPRGVGRAARRRRRPGPDRVGAAITYLEGYLWDSPAAQDAYRFASEVAHEAGAPGRTHALRRLRRSIVTARRSSSSIAGSVDVLFANDAEIADALRGRRLRRRAGQGHGTTARSPRSPAARRASVLLAGDDVVEVGIESIPGGRARRHHRRRRPLRRRGPPRLLARPRPPHLRPARRARGGRGHLPPRSPGRRPSLAELAASAGL